MNRQQDLFTDLPRGEQLQLLRVVDLPTWKHKSGKVSGAIQKAVLRAIDDHAGNRECFASQHTLAKETGYSVSAVKRAIAALVDQDFITVERPNPMASNRHRLVWNSIRLHVERSSAQVHSEPSRVHGDTSEGSHVHLPGFTEAPLRVHGEPLIAPLNANLNATTNRPDDWEAVVEEMFRWGLKTAGQAVDAARARGWSIEYVLELFHEAGGDREPNRWEPGQLANWLTGKTPPPFDEVDAIRRRETREHANDIAARAAAGRIRQSVHAAGSGQPAWLVAGITFRKLQSDGLEWLATDAEKAGAARMDEIDRQRDENQSEAENRAHRIDARSVGRQGVTSEPDNPQSVTQRLPQPQRAPRPKSRASVARTRSELLRALGAIN